MTPSSIWVRMYGHGEGENAVAYASLNSILVVGVEDNAFLFIGVALLLVLITVLLLYRQHRKTAKSEVGQV